MFILNVRDQVSLPYRTTGKIIVLNILIFMFFESNREDRRYRVQSRRGNEKEIKEIVMGNRRRKAGRKIFGKCSFQVEAKVRSRAHGTARLACPVLTTF
jgi:hypothetical protein